VQPPLKLMSRQRITPGIHDGAAAAEIDVPAHFDRRALDDRRAGSVVESARDEIGDRPLGRERPAGEILGLVKSHAAGTGAGRHAGLRPAHRPDRADLRAPFAQRGIPPGIQHGAAAAEINIPAHFDRRAVDDRRAGAVVESARDEIGDRPLGRERLAGEILGLVEGDCSQCIRARERRGGDRQATDDFSHVSSLHVKGIGEECSGRSHGSVRCDTHHAPGQCP